MLPQPCPDDKTVHHRFQQWYEQDVLRQSAVDHVRCVCGGGSDEAAEGNPKSNSSDLRLLTQLPFHHVRQLRGGVGLAEGGGGVGGGGQGGRRGKQRREPG